MLACKSIENSESVIYQVPTNKTVMAYLDIYAPLPDTTVTIKINNIVFYNYSNINFLTVKLCLNSNDEIKAYTNKTINTFLHGIIE